jgi:malate dehydrogenase (oxaloacetate-decarboxylating)
MDYAAIPSVSKEQCSPAYSVTVRIQIANAPGRFASVLQLIGEAHGSVAEITLIKGTFAYTLRDVTINTRNEEHAAEIVSLLARTPLCSLIAWQDDTFVLHRGGVLEVHPRVPVRNAEALARLYTPGVARICTAIKNDPESVYAHTTKRNTVAVVTDGTAVLGLGDIGPKAALPVMEGKAALFKQFAGVDAVPICLAVSEVEDVINAVKAISPGFGGINLEDISAPRCFEIEERLQRELDIPVFHDDQHGTAVVVVAALMNAARLVGKPFESLKVVVCGFGAGGVACTKMLIEAGVRRVVPCDSRGIVYKGRPYGMNPMKEKLVDQIIEQQGEGTIADALVGADAFVGVSRPGSVSVEMIKRMAPDPIVFVLANPVPELLPHELAGIARVVATGRSDYANQVNNALCFPGIFRGALSCHARQITPRMKIAAAQAIASLIAPGALREDHIIPSIFDPLVAETVEQRVIEAAHQDGVARTRVRDATMIEGAHRPL